MRSAISVSGLNESRLIRSIRILEEKDKRTRLCDVREERPVASWFRYSRFFSMFSY